MLSHIISNNALSRTPSHTLFSRREKYALVFPVKDKYTDSLQVTEPKLFLRFMNRKHLLTNGRLREIGEIH